MCHKMPDQKMNIETIFDQMQQAIAQIARKGPFLIMGDLNSRFQGKLHGEEDVLGLYMFGKGWAAVGGRHG